MASYVEVPARLLYSMLSDASFMMLPPVYGREVVYERKMDARGNAKGSTRRGLIMTSHGEVKRGLVCKRCALRAVAFVIPPPVTVAPPCCVCHRELAAVCKGCHTRVAGHVKGLSAANVALSVRRRK